MAILDVANLFSGSFSGNTVTGQTVTGTNTSVVSTNSVDTQGGSPTAQNIDLGKGEPIQVQVNVVTAFAGLTSLAVEFITADDGALTTNVTPLASTGPIVLAQLGAGRQIVVNVPKADPRAVRRYVGMRYTIVGTGSAGAVTAGIVEQAGDSPLFYGKSGYTIS